MKKINRPFTKQEIEKVLSLWDDKTVKQLAEEIGRKEHSVHYIAARIRKAGYKLSIKKKNGYIDGLLKEVLSEKKWMKNKK